MIAAIERILIETIARLAPWLAPIPSAYFVGRSSIEHLGVRVDIAIIIAVVIEILGISTIHNALWMADWNQTKRKSDPGAPTLVAISLTGVYFVATIGIIVFLETLPQLATYAPALFPFLAVVGGVNLALVARQLRREKAVEEERRMRRMERSGRMTVRDAFRERVVDALTAPLNDRTSDRSAAKVRPDEGAPSESEAQSEMVPCDLAPHGCAERGSQQKMAGHKRWCPYNPESPKFEPALRSDLNNGRRKEAVPAGTEA